MNANAKEQWINALRSGEYKQGKKMLHNVEENTFCCLGVLCKISGLNYNPKSPCVPQNVIMWSELNLVQPEVPLADIPEIKNKFEYWTNTIKLAHLNDEENFSFTQIADLVEKYL